MNEETTQRFENLEQRINLLQASVDSLAVQIAQLLIGQPLQVQTDVQLSDDQRRQLVRMHLDAYSTMRDQRSSKLSEFPFLPPEPPTT